LKVDGRVVDGTAKEIHTKEELNDANGDSGSSF
jgi:hypothetical protein